MVDISFFTIKLQKSEVHNDIILLYCMYVSAICGNE